MSALAHWRRWRKYPARHLALGALYQALRAARSSLSGRWDPLPRGLRSPPPGDFPDGLAARLGVPRPTPGGGIPSHPPFAPRSMEAVETHARAALEHYVDLLGSGPVGLGPRLDWQVDFKSGTRWPQVSVGQVPLTPRPGADVKVPWELGRFQHVAPLTLAYLATGDARWAVEIRTQVSDFIAANAAGRGVQWMSPMDVAIRAANWTWTLLVLASGPDLPGAELERWVSALWLHGRWVRGHLSWNPHSRGNHYLAELVGLLHVGLALGWSSQGRKWARFAARRIQREMRHQVHPDGVDFEASTNYHRLATELFAQAAALIRATSVPLGLGPDLEFDRRLAAMVTAVAGWTRADGTAPLVGDVDDGRLLAFAAPADPRRHLESLEPYGVPRVDAASMGWVHGGFYVLRGNEALVLVRCGPVGLRGRGAHDHADQLAVDVTLGGVPLFVDPGTYLYTPDPDSRNAFRATRAHNTVELDGRSQMRFTPLSLFEVERGATGRLTTWKVTSDATVFEGWHDGYLRSGGLVHARLVQLAQDGRSLRVADRVTGPPGRRAVRVSWQCDPGVTVDGAVGGDVISLRGNGRAFRIAVVAPKALQWGIEEGWVAPRYGVRERAPRLVLAGTVKVPAECEFLVTVVEPVNPRESRETRER